ncbi:allophanate hydrolase subunit 1 [Thalassobius sp. Cn5-15]|uniref:5-oxoprolinase subunit B family protein n=1 Tax=Thalassobius sp. Cn5-15 TaxID=2917763 RepID=UPI001EF20B6B|nr:carboxyltransferase domain-containing protein [Thalassobius sp. Cn5-15]MCG7493258.1 allophanate hydrolase subunit 1 [Thalassobius sp. Cn5-15]
MEPAKTPTDAEVLPLGQTGVLVRFARHASPAATARCLQLRNALATQTIHGVVEVIPSLTSVLLQFDPTQTNRAAVAKAVKARFTPQDTAEDALPAPSRRWHIPVTFGGEFGPQLADFATLSGLSEDAVVTQAQETELRVLAIGFAPGQPYLGYLPPAWQVPRQRDLTPQVPAGAIVTAVRQMVLFCNASTTGWRQIAQTGFRPFLRDRAEAFLLQQGDALCLHHVSHDTYRDLMRDNADGMGGARLEVLT